MFARQLRLFAAPLALALCFILLLAKDQRPARSGASPSLQGAAAIEHLKAQGLYGSLQEAMEIAPYRISEMQERSYRGANQAQSLQAEFDPAGLRLKPREGAKWESGMRLRGYGYGEHIVPVAAGEMKADGNRIEIHHSTFTQSTISEWYLNRPSGLEQGFTISAPPHERSVAARLSLSLEVTGDLEPHLSADGGAVVLRGQNGAEALRYSKLLAYDARGRELEAEMRLEGRELRLEVADEGAQYPLTIDPVFTQQAYLKASNTGASDRFGWSVAISGDTVVVGASQEDSSATGVDGNQNDNSAGDSGAAYVFVRSGGMWIQQAYLKASNTGVDDYFGYSVAISGDTVVVGTPGEDSNATGVNGDQSNNSAPGSGAAYVYVRSGGMWSQQAYLKPSNKGGWFGFSVAISGDTVMVGAPIERSSATGVNGDQSDNSAFQSGAAYIFVRSGGMWSQQAYLKASNTEASDQFGVSVAISGDTVVVGAPYEDSSATGVNGNQSNNSAPQSGAAYVFVRSGAIWSQQAYLKASNTGVDDYFGQSVAISGDTVVIGANGEDSNATGVDGNQSDNSALSSGAAYVFVRSGGIWSQQAYLKPSNTEADDGFGYSVAISEDTVVVAAPSEDSNATGVNGDQSDNSASLSGAAYIFFRSDEIWSQQAYLKASNTGAYDNFGVSVAISGGTVAVGARHEASSATGVNGNQNDNSAFGAGAAYTFVDLTPPICPVIPFPDLPAGTAGVAYNQTLATNHADNNSYSLVSGTLPPGFSLSSNGTISGLTTISGTYNFTILARTPEGCLDTHDYALVIGCPQIVISPTSLPNGTVGGSYSVTLSAAPAAGNYSFSITAGSLPTGLSLNATTGKISGSPSQSGLFNFTIRATGFGSCSASRSYSIQIGTASCGTITLANLGGGTLGNLYNQAATASPVGSYTYAVTSGSVPAGVTFYSSTGQLYGYPTAAGIYYFTIRASLSKTCTGSRSYAVTISGSRR